MLCLTFDPTKSNEYPIWTRGHEYYTEMSNTTQQLGDTHAGNSSYHCWTQGEEYCTGEFRQQQQRPLRPPSLLETFHKDGSTPPPHLSLSWNF